jgi:hypothetical protein
MRFPTAAFQLGSNVGLLRGVSKQWDITLSHKGLFALWSREVLVLYRKRELAMLVRGRGGIARFRYSDLKEAARVAADAGVMQI